MNALLIKKIKRNQCLRCSRQVILMVGYDGGYQPVGVRGMGLVDILISITLSAFVLMGLMSFVGTSNRNFVATTSLARMQDNGRLAVDMLGNEIRRSGFWGGVSYEDTLSEVVGGTLPITPINTACPDLGNAQNFATAIDRNLHGTNNSNVGYNCLTGSAYVNDSDILTVRYASINGVETFNEGGVFIRLAPFEGRLFLGEDAQSMQNTIIDPTARDHKLNAHSYFVGNSGRSCGGVAIPSLFRVGLDEQTAEPVVQELLPGIEQLQVQFLEQTRYKNADQVVDWNAVSAVQIWLLVRSECPEQDLQILRPNLPALSMGDIDYAQPDGRFRRKVYRQVFARRNMPLKR